ncbi:hypothetical protein Hhis01_03798 [Haloarcula hispanica]
MSECLWVLCKPEQRAILAFISIYLLSVISSYLFDWVWIDEDTETSSPWADWWAIVLWALLVYLFGGFGSKFLFF